MVVNIPVANVRLEPEHIKEGITVPALSQDIGPQGTQGLFLESILGEKLENSDWIAVMVPGQKIFTKEKEWANHPGFVKKTDLIDVENFPNYTIVLQDLWTSLYSVENKKSDVIMSLSIGTVLPAKKIDDNWFEIICEGKKYYIEACAHVYDLSREVREDTVKMRENIVKVARALVGIPYVWGGRSAYNPDLKNQITGLDCSKLTSIAYLAGAELAIPCGSRSQKCACDIIDQGTDLKPADLIFFYNRETGVVSHVALYLGDGLLIESTVPTIKNVNSLQEVIEIGVAPEKCCVRIISVKERIGVDVAQLESGKTVGPNNKIIILGSLLNSEEKIKKMRVLACGRDVSW
ncbi:MAG: NlpC/P60 family protein [bacterium]